MTNEIPPSLATEVNRVVLGHVGRLSAHSDIAEVLLAAVKPLGDVQLFCPDWEAYRSVVVATKGVIFGLAALGHGREPPDVGEEHGHLPPLPANELDLGYVGNRLDRVVKLRGNAP